MATRRWFLPALTRRAAAVLSSTPTPTVITHPITKPIEQITTNLRYLTFNSHFQFSHERHFSSTTRDDNNEDDDGSETSADEEDEYDDVANDSEDTEAIGYKVIGPLDKSERVFKPYEPLFAVVQVGSHQFKVSNGDTVYVERLKYCDVNDKLLLNKVLLLGSSTQTIIGRPILPDAAVYAVVEEHALDEKVIIFKKKRRKNYRRTRGHRQELTRLRIIDVQGIEKPETPVAAKPSKPAGKKPEKTPVAA